MASNTYVALSTQTLGSPTTSVTFSSIPQGYTDLVLVLNGTTGTTSTIGLRFNSDTASNYSCTYLLGSGSSAASGREVSQPYLYLGTSYTSDGMTRINIQNYSNSTTKKTAISRSDNAGNRVASWVGLWQGTAAITSVEVTTSGGGNFNTGTTFTLYGVAADTNAYTAKATGGTITADVGYIYHTFTGNGTFTPLTGLSCDILVVAGGGGSWTGIGGGGSGGGGAGGLLGFTSQSLTATGYTVTVGAGGTDSNGSNSQFGSLTAAVGGGRGGQADTIGSAGGSGGGTGFRTPSSGTAAGTSGQGNAGGNTSGSYPNFNSGGGGGAGGAGGTGGTNGGAGGIGSSAYSSWATVTNTGQSGYYAGGGGGMIWYPSGSPGAGGTGGGGTGAATSTSSGSNGAANTGGGAGGSAQTATSGGSGVVIVRYAK